MLRRNNVIYYHKYRILRRNILLFNINITNFVVFYNILFNIFA